MVKLSGILEYSMGNFLCLRGFASFQLLSNISEPNPEVQRDLIEEHKGEMTKFLNGGEYRFFPEMILSLNLIDDTMDFDDLDLFHRTLQSGETWNKSIGDFQFSISQNITKNIIGRYSKLPHIDRINIAHIKFDETANKLIRVDGNHRLSAADEVEDDFTAPFCLLLFRYPRENEQYSRAIFHNINAKQIPLNLEENLRVILESPDVFPDDKLKNDPSFGFSYYLARKVAEKVTWGNYPFIQNLIRGSEYTYLKEEFELLLKCTSLPEDDTAIDSFIEELTSVEVAIKESQLQCVPQNLAVVGTLSYYKLTDTKKYSSFLRWAKENCIVEAPGIHMDDLISVFNKVYENMPKTVFMSMPFKQETRDTYQTVKDVQDILKKENGIEFEIIKVDENTDGYSDQIYHRIIKGIRDSSLVIADLSYGNNNVHHEIGYAQGLGKKVLLLYKTREGFESKKEIGSNISMHDQLRFADQTELRPALLKKIRYFFDLEVE